MACKKNLIIASQAATLFPTNYMQATENIM